MIRSLGIDFILYTSFHIYCDDITYLEPVTEDYIIYNNKLGINAPQKKLNEEEIMEIFYNGLEKLLPY